MIISKTFEELTKEELYEILKIRSAIFIVEQQCAYQDIDDLDKRSLHVFEMKDGRVTCCLRGYLKSKMPRTVHVGRVLTAEHGKGLGGKLLHAGIQAVKNHFSADEIFIEAQTYAQGFYEREGFQVIGEEFDEDGIPHVPMLLKFTK